MVVEWLELADEVDAGPAAGRSPVAHLDVELARAHATTCTWSRPAVPHSIISTPKSWSWKSWTGYVWAERRRCHPPWRDPPRSSCSIFFQNPDTPPCQPLTATDDQPSNNPCSPHLLQVTTLAHHLRLHRTCQSHFSVSQSACRGTHVSPNHVRA